MSWKGKWLLLTLNVALSSIVFYLYFIPDRLQFVLIPIKMVCKLHLLTSTLVDAFYTFYHHPVLWKKRQLSISMWILNKTVSIDKNYKGINIYEKRVQMFQNFEMFSFFSRPLLGRYREIIKSLIPLHDT